MDEQESGDIHNRQQKDHYNYRQKSLPRQISDGRGEDDYVMSQEAKEETRQLKERHEDLLRRQYELIEQKRKIQKEQEEINQFIHNQKDKLYGGDRDYDPPRYTEQESKVERFMKLANALYVCDQDQSGG